MLNILVVEDRFEDMEYITDILKQQDVDIDVYRAGTSSKALKLLCSHNIDVAFLDIELPDMNGFTLANRIREMEGYELLHIVFVTGSNADPLKAHKKYHCYDYIKKPFTKEAFAETILPLLHGLAKQKETGRPPKTKKEKMVFLECGRETFLVRYDDIVFAEINGREITVYTEEQKYSGIKMKFDSFISSVNSATFKRCHKSYAVNVDKISRIESISSRSWDIYFETGDRGNVQEGTETGNITGRRNMAESARGNTAESAAGNATKRTEKNAMKCMMSKTYRDEILAAIAERNVDDEH